MTPYRSHVGAVSVSEVARRPERAIPHVLVFALFLAGCGGDAADRPAPDAVAAGEPGAGGYTAVTVTRGGTIRGTVRFAGDLPPAQALTITEDSETCGLSRQIQPIELGGDRGLADVVVSLADVSRGAALEPPATPPTLDQRGCRFDPQVLLAPVGHSVHVLNSDPITHNVHTASFENRSVNRTQPTGLDAIELAFSVAEKVRVRCDLHPWMSAWIVVQEHPYYAVTDTTGTFVLTDIPPGTYTLEAWHESLGAQTQSITVVADQTAEITLELTIRG